jgi:glycerophosphoryl diester phosphodiesterase
MYPDLPKPAIIAHRGASAHAPENTFSAFELAIRQGADAIELDVDLCQDQHLVVIHDRTVDRTTNGSGKVGDLSQAALQELDAGSHFDLAYKGERIPGLEEVLATFGTRIAINIELKGSSSSSKLLAEKVADLIQRHGLIGKVIISSFDPWLLRRMNRLLPEVACALLAEGGRKGALLRGRVGEALVRYEALHPDVQDASLALVKRIHERGRRINVYTVNTPQGMRALFSAGVDGIFTDDPLLARSVLQTGLPVEYY